MGFGSFVSFVSGGCLFPRFSCTWWVLAGSALNTKNRLYIILYYTIHKHHRERELLARLHKKDRVLLFFKHTHPQLPKPTKPTKPPDDDNAASSVTAIQPQPTPELLTIVGHAILRSVAIGQGDPLRHAADALGRLDKLLPNASAECRLTATLMALTDDPTPREETTVQSPTPTPARRQAKEPKPAKASRNPKPATPLMDIHGKLISSREIGGVAVVSQAEARKVLGVSCVQMLKLENQKLLSRIQESGSRLVFYDVCQVQHLLDMIDRTPPPPL